MLESACSTMYLGRRANDEEGCGITCVAQRMREAHKPPTGRTDGRCLPGDSTPRGHHIICLRPVAEEHTPQLPSMPQHSLCPGIHHAQGRLRRRLATGLGQVIESPDQRTPRLHCCAFRCAGPSSIPAHVRHLVSMGSAQIARMRLLILRIALLYRARIWVTGRCSRRATSSKSRR